jgi:succinate dehydrogenase/fumarate reductase cytochrome b subunit
MQDTPQFIPLQQRFSSYTQEEILGQNPGQAQPITDPDASVIRSVFEVLQLYFNDTTYRQKLVTQSKQNTEGQITAIFDQFDQIRAQRNSSTLPQQLPSIIQNISSNFDELRIRFLTPYKVAQIEGNTDTARIITDLQEKQKEASDIKDEIGKILDISKDYAERRSSTDQANFFHRMYNGKPFPDKYDESVQKKMWIPQPQTIFLTVLGLILAILASPAVYASFKDISHRSLIQCLIGVGIVAFIFICYGVWYLKKLLDKSSPSGYERSAKIWLILVVISLAFVGIYSVIVIKSLNITEGNISIQEAIIKAVVLFAPVYLIRFCVRNYNAYKHLATRNLQRANSIRATELFIQGANKETLELYMKLTDHLFSQDESGFITKRDGAGGGDNVIDLPFVKQ